MRKATVWVDNWEIECCGNGFKIGDAISWDVSKWRTVFPDSLTRNMDYAYNAHASMDDVVYKIDGIVLKIEAIYTLYKLIERKNIPTAHRFEPFDGEAYGQHLPSIGAYKFTGYVVLLEYENDLVAI